MVASLLHEEIAVFSHLLPDHRLRTPERLDIVEFIQTLEQLRDVTGSQEKAQVAAVEHSGSLCLFTEVRAEWFGLDSLDADIHVCIQGIVIQIRQERQAVIEDGAQTEITSFLIANDSKVIGCLLYTSDAADEL